MSMLTLGSASCGESPAVQCVAPDPRVGRFPLLTSTDVAKDRPKIHDLCFSLALTCPKVWQLLPSLSHCIYLLLWVFAKGLIEYDSLKEVPPKLASAKYSGLIQQSFPGHNQL